VDAEVLRAPLAPATTSGGECSGHQEPEYSRGRHC
jgi:hypothetical protein